MAYPFILWKDYNTPEVILILLSCHSLTIPISLLIFLRTWKKNQARTHFSLFSLAAQTHHRQSSPTACNLATDEYILCSLNFEWMIFGLLRLKYVVCNIIYILYFSLFWWRDDGHPKLFYLTPPLRLIIFLIDYFLILIKKIFIFWCKQ